MVASRAMLSNIIQPKNKENNCSKLIKSGQPPSGKSTRPVLLIISTTITLSIRKLMSKTHSQRTIIPSMWSGAGRVVLTSKLVPSAKHTIKKKLIKLENLTIGKALICFKLALSTGDLTIKLR